MFQVKVGLWLDVLGYSISSQQHLEELKQPFLDADMVISLDASIVSHLLFVEQDYSECVAVDIILSKYSVLSE